MRLQRFVAAMVFLAGLLMVFTVLQRRSQRAAAERTGVAFDDAAWPTVVERVVIDTPAAPAPGGPWSQAVLTDDTVWCSGQVGLDPATGRLIAADAGAQARQALANARAVLAAAGCSLADAVHAQVLLTDLADLPAVDQVWAEHFPQAPPARTVAQVIRLPHEARVAITLAAHRPRR